MWILSGRAEPSTARHSTKGSGLQRREALGSRADGETGGNGLSSKLEIEWNWSLVEPAILCLTPLWFTVQALYCGVKPSSRHRWQGVAEGCFPLCVPHSWGLSAALEAWCPPIVLYLVPLSLPYPTLRTHCRLPFFFWGPDSLRCARASGIRQVGSAMLSLSSEP